MPIKKNPADPDNPDNQDNVSSETSPKPATRKPRAKKDASVESASVRAKSAAKKVAAAVSGTVKEIADKVTGKKPAARKTSAKKTADSAHGPASETKTVRSTRTLKTGETPKPARVSRARTKVAALAQGTTSEDVQELISDQVSSEDVAAEQADELDSATDVREHFFHDQHVHQGPPPPQPPRDLPDEYGDTKVVALVRDPEWIFAYWEVNDHVRHELNFPRQANGNDQQVVLRVYKIMETAWPVDPAHYFFDIEVPYDARHWYIHLPETDQQWCIELGIRTHHEEFRTICRSNIISTPRNIISDRVDSDWMTVEESFEKVTRFSRASLNAQLQGAGSTSSEAILRTINRQLTAVLHGEKVALSSGIFSSEALLPQRQKDFWLQVHTELILYGATEPDARVTVQGKPVKLNEDGTFSLRFSLPDGVQVLEVRATNADGDLEEQITPVVQRRTE